jgi:hypothetical protein
MNYADFDSYMIRERNAGLLREVSTLRLEKRLRENRVPRSSRLIAFARRFLTGKDTPLLGETTSVPSPAQLLEQESIATFRPHHVHTNLETEVSEPNQALQ